MVTALLATPTQAAAPTWSAWQNMAYDNQCLDGSISQGVRLNTCNGGTYQEWSPKSNGDIVHRQSGKCLDGSISQGVRLNTCNGGSFQWWLPR
ncbi:RICIN domain-containing protein [Streptomyces phytophilus]|uniref:RICIN domain-containing protein n=1 Tax=Streptomyces phytophilus TaxID=722715 RepID=UPI002867FC8B|nr:RICIN domain-containing protein [Streptomyces phytophilus]